MAEILITQSQLELLEKNICHPNDLNLAEQNWNSFNKEQKKAVVECLLILYPNKKIKLNEAWYNTLGDIIGLFDPTGVVDLVNGISYISQGEKLFGFLSIISAVPYAGDIVAKPIMAQLKIGAPSAKALKKVLDLSDAGKAAEAAKELERISSYGGLTSKFVNGLKPIIGKLRGYIDKFPMGPFSGLKKTILQWLDLFAGVGKGTVVRQRGQMLSKVFTKISPQLQKQHLENLIKSAKSTPGIFTGYRTSKGIFSWKTLFRGMPQLMGRNASVRALARQTKWWAGFLDYMGFGNFVGPDEVLKKMGEENFINKVKEYNNTKEGKDNFEFDFGGEQEKTSPQQPSDGSSQQQKSNQDPIANFFRNLFLGQINPIP